VVGLDAKLIVARAQRHPDVERFECIETTDKQATWEIQIRGRKPKRYTYTIDMARRAGLVEKDNWKKHPDAMLRARCATALVGMEFPEATMGFVSTDEAEEAGSYHSPQRATVVVSEIHEERASDPDLLATLRARFAAVTTREELAAVVEATPAELRSQLKADLNAAKARIKPPTPPSGGGAPKPETPANTDATGNIESNSPESTDSSKASAQAILMQWCNHLKEHTSPQHVLNSVVAHVDDFDLSLHEQVIAAAINRLESFAWSKGKDLRAMIDTAIQARRVLSGEAAA
jgi:hypothetical protein